MGKALVYLVGAGPGDPELITIKAVRVLEHADVLLYDYLVHPNIVMIAEKATKICVGKKKGGHSATQDGINQYMIDYASNGKVVVRIKGGDPMIFGRCGEEMSVLEKHNIPYEIIPGITSAIAVPTYAGIPLTLRGSSQSVAFVTATREYDSQNMKLPIADTLVIMMSLLRLEGVVNQLRASWPETTPIAIVESGTLSIQRQLIGNLGTIIEQQRLEQMTPPALLIVGAVAAMGHQFQWRNHLPLRNRRIVLFRAMHQQSTIRDALFQAGAEVICLPMNHIQTDISKFKSIDLDTITHVILTSENGVSALMEWLIQTKQDLRQLANKQIVAVGEHTANTLMQRGVVPDIVPKKMNAKGVIHALMGRINSSHHILWPTSSQSDAEIAQGLSEMGATIHQVIAYTNECPTDAGDNLHWLKSGDDLIFMNAAAARRFFTLCREQALQTNGFRMISIGPKTTKQIQQFTNQSIIESPRPGVSDIVDLMIQMPPQ